MGKNTKKPSPGSKKSKQRAKSAKREARHRVWKVVKVSSAVVGALIVFGVGAGSGYAASMLKGLPPLNPHQFNNESEASVVYDKNGQVIGRFTKDGDRQPITSIDQVSPNLVNSFIAAEDKTFYQNIGVNPLAMARAFVSDFIGHRIESGASTITQQTVKLALFPAQERTMRRKIQEIALAIQLNNMLSKDEIMTDYMNWVPMGRMGPLYVYGVKAASEIMFHKDPSALNLPESAFLASIPNNPTLFSPYDNFDNTTKRQHYILNQMLINHMITQQQYDDAMQFNIKKVLQKPQERFDKYPYIMIDNIEPLVDEYLVKQGLYSTTADADAALPTAGYRIYTSIDLNVQKDVDNVLSNQALFAGTDMPVPGTKNQKDLYEAGVTIIDNQTGGILALGGGRDFSQDEYDHTDIARQPGSSMKPLVVYGPAIDMEKYTAATPILDQPLHLVGYPKSPQNDDGLWHGIVTPRQALTASMNVPAMKVFQSITPQAGTSYLAKMGITPSSTTIFGKPTLQQSDTQQIATAIGGLEYGLTVQQMTSAYSTFPNQGVWRQSYLVQRITDRDSNVVYQVQPQVNRVYSPQAAYILTSMMHDVVYDTSPYPWTGTAVSIGSRFPGYFISGKTGTTDSQRDGWFIGFTSKYTAGIWMGYNHHQAIPSSIYGLKFAIWSDIMQPLFQQDPPKKPFPNPGNVVTVAVARKSGMLPTSLTRASHDVYNELFIKGTEPTTYDTTHVQAQYVIYNGKKYLATTNTPPGDVKVGIFLVPPEKPTVKTLDSWEYVPTQPDPRGGTVLGTATPNSGSGLMAPINVTAVPSATGVQLSWDTVPGATQYTVWRATSKNGPYTNIAGPMADTSYVDASLPANATTVYYEIYAMSDVGGISSPSTPVQVNVPNQMPTGSGLDNSTGDNNIFGNGAGDINNIFGNDSGSGTGSGNTQG